MPTILRSGEAFNVVPGAGELFCDCRADELDAIEAVLDAIPREVGGVTLQPELIRRWPGMHSEQAVAAVLARASEALGRPIRAASRGGASDASHFAAAIPVTIDGLGPRGGKAHNPGEFVYEESLTPRAEVRARRPRRRALMRPAASTRCGSARSGCCSSARRVSLLGDGMVGVALAFAVLELTGSASDLGIVLAARTVPLVAFLLVGGVWADRLPRRALMVTTDLIRLRRARRDGGAADHRRRRASGLLAALAAIAGAASAFFNPAISGIMPAVVSTERLQQANALRGLTEGVRADRRAGARGRARGRQSGRAGRSPSTPPPSASAPRSSAAIPMPAHVPVESHSFIADLRDGWDDFRSRTWLWTTVASTTFGNMMFAAYFVLGPLVADRELGGAGAWALIASAFGVGLLVGGIVLLQLDPQRPALVATLAVALYTLPLAFLAIPAPARGDRRRARCWPAPAWRSPTTCGRRPSSATCREELLSRVSSYDWFGSLAAVPIGMLLWGPIGDADRRQRRRSGSRSCSSSRASCSCSRCARSASCRRTRR